MPKNPHPPRNGGPSKKAVPTGEGSNGKKARDKKIADFEADPFERKDGKPKSKAKQKEAAAPAEDGPKKPTAREVVAGSSWTGKLPLNLFNEHCQRARWEKPEYTMHKLPAGFVSSVILRSKNPKTGEVTELPPTRFPRSHEHLQPRETAVEARHFAAAWALFRVANMKNIHLTLPPQFKDLWRGPFTEIKNEDVKAGQAWMYAADPFQAYREHEQERAKATKQKEEAVKERVKRDVARASGDLIGASTGDPLRDWKTAPRVELGRRLRRDVEALVRREGVWNINDVSMTPKQRVTIAEGLASLGFRRSHCDEAVGICKDREESLEWLLVHVPEDDLPKWALPENYIAGVSMAGDGRREAILKRLTAAGYAREACEDSLDEAKGDETKAASVLQHHLLRSDQEDEGLEKLLSPMSLHTDPLTDEDGWSEEQETLDSIYAGHYERLSASSCTIKLPVGSTPLSVRITKPAAHYPNTLPVVQITGSLPAYVKLAMTKQALIYAAKECLGQPMIFSLIDWLEQNAQMIIDSPGSLSAIAGASLPSVVEERPYSRPAKRQKQRHPRPLDLTPGTAASKSLLTEWQTRQQSAAQQKMLSTRQSLPAWSKQEAVVSAVASHQVTIISGATGSGKSTQAVQFILDDLIQNQLGSATKIICTQPRRISALGLADRVAEERCGTVGDEVGFAIRGESKQSNKTKITFCTTGVLLRRMQTSSGSKEDLVKSLADVSHVCVDEVHERSLDTDFLLALLKDVISVRKDIRVILMSATLDAAAFENYFGGPSKVARVEVEGRTFPVDDYYLDNIVSMTGFRGDQILDNEISGAASALTVSKAIQSIGIGINYQLIAALVSHIDRELGDDPGGILIFLPGTMEISKTLDALRSMHNMHALPLHASLLSAEQRRVFPPAPKGKRKVIAATNVAETSITIPDIVAVVDSGRVKETQYDPQSSVVKLVEVWASKAACQQRRGRAGRVRPGVAYKLFTRQAESDRMPDKPEPEIRRTPLEQLCLSVKAMGSQDVAQFLAGTITPPEGVAIQGALQLLRRMGALEDDTLTALGQHMAMIPGDLRCAKMMVLGALFGCLDAALTIASVLTVKSPFVSPQDKRDQAKAAREAFGKGQNVGDLIIDLRAFDQWSSLANQPRTPFRQVRAWCEGNFLSHQTLNDIASTRQQYKAALQETGIVGPRLSPEAESNLSRNSNSLPMLGALTLASLSPQTLRILYPPTKYTATSSGNLPLDPTAKSIQFFDEANSRVFIHPSSTLFSAQGYSGSPGFMSFWNKVATSKVFARELCPAGTFAVLLFGGSGIEVDKIGRGVIIDGWMRVRGWARIGVLVGRLRSVIDAKLREWFEQPGQHASTSEIVSLVKRLVELDGLDQ